MIIDILKYLKCVDNILSTVHILSLHNYLFSNTIKARQNTVTAPLCPSSLQFVNYGLNISQQNLKFYKNIFNIAMVLESFVVRVQNINTSMCGMR